MTIQQFSTATHNVQQAVVRFKGQFLLERKAGACMALLYQVDDFYVELICPATSRNKIKVIRCFTVRDIDVYLPQVDITTLTRLLT